MDPTDSESPQPRPWQLLQDPSNPEHCLVVTGDNDTNGRVLIVRCRCMAEIRRSSPRFYGYDYLARVTSLEDVRYVYQRHLATGEKLIRLDLDVAV